MKYLLLFLLHFLNLFLPSAQQNNLQSEVSYADLEQRLRSPEIELPEQKKLSDLWILKAKTEKNNQQLFQAYSWRGKIASGNQQLAYGDSLIQTANRIGNLNTIGEAYISMGAAYVNNEAYRKALDSYLIAYRSFQVKNDPLLLASAEYQIAQVKIYLNEYEDAQKILTKNTIFFRENAKIINHTDYRLYYIYSLISLIDTNTKLGLTEENPKLIQEGKNFIKKEKLPHLLGYFESAEGTDAYFEKDFALAASKMISALAMYNDQWKHLTENFYLGMSYWQLNRKEEAIPHLLMIDQEYEETKKLDPMFRPALETLLQYYREKNDHKKQIEYLDKLIALNTIYEKDYRYLYANLNKEFDNKVLIKEKLSLEKSSQKQKIKYTVLLVLSFVIILLLASLAIRYYRNQNYYRKLLHEFNNDNEQLKESEEEENNDIVILKNSKKEIFVKHEDYISKEPVNKQNNESDKKDSNSATISSELVSHVLQKLQEFESQKSYLKKNITLNDLALICGTNTTYLSKVINQTKNKNFNQYLNDLRLDEVIKRWKNSPKTRQYTIQQIAEKVGFSTAQSFSKNFQERYHISPSYFLKRLNEDVPIN